MVQVDVIGIESVVKLIESSKLGKFIVFRQGYIKGSTPLFKCLDTKDQRQAATAFRNWGNTILMSNPSNNLPYEIFLYNAENTEEAIEEDLMGAVERAGKKAQKDKVKFSFTLNPYNNYNSSMGGGLTANDVKNILDERDKEAMLRNLQEENARLKAGIGVDSEEEEDDDDENENEGVGSAIGKAIEFIKEANENMRLKIQMKKKGAAISNDEEEEEEMEEEEEDFEEEMDDDDDEPQQKPAPKKVEVSDDTKNKVANINKAVKILLKHDAKLDTDLLKLASLAQKNPVMFKNILSTLRNLKI